MNNEISKASIFLRIDLKQYPLFIFYNFFKVLLRKHFTFSPTTSFVILVLSRELRQTTKTWTRQ